MWLGYPFLLGVRVRCPVGVLLSMPPSASTRIGSSASCAVRLRYGRVVVFAWFLRRMSARGVRVGVAGGCMSVRRSGFCIVWC